jgi:hypothetical protein
MRRGKGEGYTGPIGYARKSEQGERDSRRDHPQGCLPRVGPYNRLCNDAADARAGVSIGIDRCRADGLGLRGVRGEESSEGVHWCVCGWVGVYEVWWVERERDVVNLSEDQEACSSPPFIPRRILV